MTRAVWALLLAGCAGFAEPGPEVMARIRALPELPGPFLRVQAVMDIDSEWLSGTFEGIVIAKTGPSPVVRAQFFPDLGGKAFDLVARPDRITGTLPPIQESVDSPMPLEGRPHPLHFIGITLLERFAPVTVDRVRGARDDGWVLLDPVVAGTRPTVLLDENDRIIRRRYEWVYGVTWDESLGAEARTIRAPGIRLRIVVKKADRRERVPDAVFRLPVSEE